MNAHRTSPVALEDLTGVRLAEFPLVELGTDYRQMVRLIREIQPGGMVLEAKEFAGLRGSRGMTAAFTERPEVAESRQNSGHHLYFGKLMLDSESDHELPTPVAVKPYRRDYFTGPTRAYALAHEWAANETVSGLSLYERAYLPLGVWKTTNRTPQLITLMDEPVKTFDDIFWAEGKAAEGVSEGKIIKAMHLSMYALGVLHGAGLAHGDASIQNFGRDSKQVRFVDLETLGMLPTEGKSIVPTTDSRRMINKDINKFAGTILGHRDAVNDVSPMVARLMAEDRVIASSTRHYWEGVVQGEARGDTYLPDELVIQPETLQKAFSVAIQIRKDTGML